MRIRSVFLFLLITQLIAQSCRPARHIEEGKYIVSRARVHLNKQSDISYEADVEDLDASIKQKPYRRWFGIVPFNVSVWNFTYKRNQEKRLISYLKETIGEAPPVFEPYLLKKSVEQMEATLRNNGYFEGSVSAEIDTNRRKVKMNFYVESGEAYTMRAVGYAFEDTAIAKEFRDGFKGSFKRGARFDSEVFENERDRLTKMMKNRGYFTFEKIHVIFDVDTNLPGRKFDVTVRLRNLRLTQNNGQKDTVVQRSHQIHTLRSISINENYNASSKRSTALDTVDFANMQFLYKEKLIVRPSRLKRNIFIKPGDIYTLDRTNYTYDRLNALGNFRFIDMRYSPLSSDTNGAELDLLINLTKSPRQSFSVQTTGTHRSGNLGIFASFDYRNRNLFRGAEQLDWSIYGGLESQRTNGTQGDVSNEVIENVKLFNTYEFGARVGLTVPDFLFRFSRKDMTWAKEPKTNISASIDRQFRPQYDRTLLNTNYRYTMRLRDKDQLAISPIDLSVISLSKDSIFERQLQLTNNALLINSYNDHVIAAGKVSYSNMTKDDNVTKNYHYYTFNFETSGNILRALGKPLGLDYDAERDSYLVRNIAFSQYIKLDGNFVKYFILNEHSKMVYRLFGGIGVPLTNLNVIPFERSFFAGGSNDIRAWRARALGPGGLSETETYGIDQVGEVQLEINTEYRFHIIKIIEGALFMDVGNIWLVKKDPERPNAEFDPTRFYKEIAIAPGAGIRLDFSFFVLRLDAGLQLKDPQLPVGERWLFQGKEETLLLRKAANIERVSDGFSEVKEWNGAYRPQVTFNLGILYPF